MSVEMGSQCKIWTVQAVMNVGVTEENTRRESKKTQKLTVFLARLAAWAVGLWRQSAAAYGAPVGCQQPLMKLYSSSVPNVQHHTIYWHGTDVSTASSSSQSLLASQLAKMCKRVVIKHGRWTLDVCWHQDISRGCASPCEAAPRFHPHFCYIPEIVDWIGIWGVPRPGMRLWALCHVFQMLCVIWWGKLPSQAGCCMAAVRFRWVGCNEIRFTARTHVFLSLED